MGEQTLIYSKHESFIKIKSGELANNGSLSQNIKLPQKLDRAKFWGLDRSSDSDWHQSSENNKLFESSIDSKNTDFKICKIGALNSATVSLLFLDISLLLDISVEVTNSI